MITQIAHNIDKNTNDIIREDIFGQIDGPNIIWFGKVYENEVILDLRTEFLRQNENNFIIIEFAFHLLN